eukprot:SAG31_NODE_1361_length_8631_cov_3.401899_1_plen_99_part_00
MCTYYGCVHVRQYGVLNLIDLWTMALCYRAFDSASAGMVPVPCLVHVPRTTIVIIYNSTICTPYVVPIGRVPARRGPPRVPAANAAPPGVSSDDSVTV